MAINFQLPSFVKPQEYEGISNIPRTIDEIYNTYLRAKQVQGQQALQSSELDLRKLQIEQAKREIAAKNLQEQIQWGGPVGQITPEQIAQARMPAQSGGFTQGPIAPGSVNQFQEQIGMAQGQQQEHPVVGKLRGMFEKQNAAELIDKELKGLGIRKERAETQTAEAKTGEVGIPSNFNDWVTRQLNAGKLEPERAAKLLSMASPSFGTAQQKQEEKKTKVAASEASAKAHALDVVDAAKSALNLVGKFSTTGITGKALGNIPGTDRKALEGYIDTLKANLSFGALTEMRANSPTGGALGQVSDIELRLLSSTVRSLNPDQPPDVLATNINKVLSKYQEITGETVKSAEQPPKNESAAAPIALPADKAKRLQELRAKKAQGKL